MTTLRRQLLTKEQAEAVEYYRTASAGYDFSRLLHAVAALHQRGLDESTATQAIAMGYVVIGGDED